MSENDLILACENLGVHVLFFPIVLPGKYVWETGLIVVDSRLSPGKQLAVLAHEYVHALLGHRGCQPEHIEKLVARKAAKLLVSPVEFKTAALLCDDNLSLIAEELGLPLWIVEAYAEQLDTTNYPLCG